MQPLLQARRVFHRPHYQSIWLRYIGSTADGDPGKSLPRYVKTQILLPADTDPLLLKAQYLYSHKPDLFPEINADLFEFVNIYPQNNTAWHILIAANRNNVPLILEIYEKYKKMNIKAKNPVFVRIFNTLIQNQEIEKAYKLFKEENLRPEQANELWKQTDNLAFANEIYHYISQSRPSIIAKAVVGYIKCLSRLSVSSARAFLLRKHLRGERVTAEMYTRIIWEVGQSKDMGQLWELYNEICQTGIPLFYPKSYILAVFGKARPELLFAVLKGETVKTNRVERKILDLLDDKFINEDFFRRRLWRGVAFGFIDQKKYELIDQVLQHKRVHFGLEDDEKIWFTYVYEVAQSEGLDRGLEILYKAREKGTKDIAVLFEALTRVAYKKKDRKWLMKMVLEMKKLECKMTTFVAERFDEMGIPISHLV
ncbi:hypothetical protein NEOLI_001813 [Neolecta irregularis DAH-3]|uniref:Pentatricopeptide repeat-containing protein n=1 Tax=Neolecta irregularis (strain DAH-3) TaxID=1198029 RepID=A0A1U7LPF0_NEOID|nr:hypothetical protein NEOLI_001813 [Neolecta irregularis DAH-3]|eukprot:OLL24550.1 hypothetical protein NEOLI_001813 [Neolecta irregularis DAH-3]